MTLGCEELSDISGAIDRVLTARICSVVCCGEPSFFGVARPSVEVAVALFKVVAAGVITPKAPAENNETITFITVDFAVHSRTSTFLALPFIICRNFHDVICCETNL